MVGRRRAPLQPPQPQVPPVLVPQGGEVGFVLGLPCAPPGRWDMGTMSLWLSKVLPCCAPKSQGCVNLRSIAGQKSTGRVLERCDLGADEVRG